MVAANLSAPSTPTSEPTIPPEIGAIYEAHFDFVWRSLRRLRVPDSCIDDATHDVFLVAQRRLAEFQGRSSMKTWLFSIALRIAKSVRRTLAQRGTDELPDATPDTNATPPDEMAGRIEAMRLVNRLLDSLDDAKRAVFVLAELEQMPAPEIAQALEIPLNTVYSRLRAARREFDAALARQHCRESWRTP